MSADHERAETGTGTEEEELAQVRQARFGHLPPRVRPEDLVESEPAEPGHEEPEEPMVRREWG